MSAFMPDEKYPILLEFRVGVELVDPSEILRQKRGVSALNGAGNPIPAPTRAHFVLQRMEREIPAAAELLQILSDS